MQSPALGNRRQSAEYIIILLGQYFFRVDEVQTTGLRVGPINGTIIMEGG
jgi:hypothetical protein